MMTVSQVSFGVIIDDIVLPDGRTHMGTLGGGGPQTVWGMALAVGRGDTTGLVAGVGADLPAGLLAPLQAAGIDLSGVFTTGEHPTPRAWELTETDGRRTHVWRTDPSAYFGTQIGLDWAVLVAFYPHVEVAHWGIHPDHPRLALCAPLRERGALISIEAFNGSQQPLSDHALQAILSQCHIFSPNWDEAISIFGTTDRDAMLRRCRTLGVHILALRRGADGAELWDVVAGTGVRVPAAPPRAVVDPVGAGNTFCGAFAVTYHRTGDLVEAGVRASVAASYLVEQIGLPPALPSPADLEKRQQIVRGGAERLSL